MLIDLQMHYSKIKQMFPTLQGEIYNNNGDSYHIPIPKSK